MHKWSLTDIFVIVFLYCKKRIILNSSTFFSIGNKAITSLPYFKITSGLVPALHRFASKAWINKIESSCIHLVYIFISIKPLEFDVCYIDINVLLVVKVDSDVYFSVLGTMNLYRNQLLLDFMIKWKYFLRQPQLGELLASLLHFISIMAYAWIKLHY